MVTIVPSASASTRTLVDGLYVMSEVTIDCRPAIPNDVAGDPFRLTFTTSIVLPRKPPRTREPSPRIARSPSICSSIFVTSNRANPFAPNDGSAEPSGRICSTQVRYRVARDASKWAAEQCSSVDLYRFAGLLNRLVRCSQVRVPHGLPHRFKYFGSDLAGPLALLGCQYFERDRYRGCSGRPITIPPVMAAVHT